MPYQEVREEGGEGRARPSCLMSPMRACLKSPADQVGRAGWRRPPISCRLNGSHPSMGGQDLGSTEGTRITTMIREAFDNMLLKEASHNYDNYGLVSQ